MLKSENANQLQIHLCKFCYDRNFSEKKMSLVKYSVYVSIVKTRLHICFICKNFFQGTLPSIVDTILNSEMLGSIKCVPTIDIGTRLPYLFYRQSEWQWYGLYDRVLWQF